MSCGTSLCYYALSAACRTMTPQKGAFLLTTSAFPCFPGNPTFQHLLERKLVCHGTPKSSPATVIVVIQLFATCHSRDTSFTILLISILVERTLFTCFVAWLRSISLIPNSRLRNTKPKTGMKYDMKALSHRLKEDP